MATRTTAVLRDSSPAARALRSRKTDRRDAHPGYGRASTRRDADETVMSPRRVDWRTSRRRPMIRFQRPRAMRRRPARSPPTAAARRPEGIDRRCPHRSPISPTQRSHRMSAHFQRPPDPDQVLVDIADYVLDYEIASEVAYRHRAQLPDRHARLRPRGARVSRPAPSCSGPIVPGTVVPNGAQGAGHAVPARPGAGRVQHRRHDPLARLQRHLARRRMGPSVRQPRRHPRHRRLAVAQRRRRGQASR